ncbi:hypothetical protein SAMN06269173_10424 [Hymenobacter mucosus]|uniref:Uncharacterized protein n=1 Tax=Hymenobacter mucosus TaxID=1411120 RepID=A0A238XF54_9BACT|nr:hypothetical protein SAMN06269173_10424 [Hymenobacter mucosus]
MEAHYRKLTVNSFIGDATGGTKAPNTPLGAET